MLLEHFNLKEEAETIQYAVEKSLEKGVVTPDLDKNSTYGTNKVGDFIADFILHAEDTTQVNKENIEFGQSTII